MYIPKTKTFVVVVIATVFVLFLGAVAYKVFFKTSDTPRFAEEYGVVLTDYDGKQVPLSHFRYSPIVVFMWASWCPYCSDELKNLTELKKRYGDNIEVLAVNRAEPLPTAKEFTDGLDLSGLTLLLDPNDSLYHTIEGYAMPETIFVDTNGDILFHQRGPIQMNQVDEQMKRLGK